MDCSENKKSSNLSNTIEQNNENTKSVQEIEPLPTKGTQQDLNSIEFAPGKTDNEKNSLIDKNIEMLSVVIQEADNHTKSDEFGAIYNSSKGLVDEESAKPFEKEVIEILNVELVTPSRDGYVQSIESQNELKEGDVHSENTPMLSSKVDVAKNADYTQNQYDTDLEETKMDTLEENNAVSSPSENQHSDKCPENVGNVTEPPITSGLSLLAQYQSDDDADSVVEVPLTAAQDYRNQVFEIDSDSDSDDSNSSSDVEYLNKLRTAIEKRIEIADDDDLGDEEQEECSGKKKQQQKLRVKGELLLEDLPPIQDLQITVPENDCIEFGKIHSIVDQLVLVSALPNSILLDLETVIFLEKGQKVLGEVFDVLGQVADPLYCVRFNSNKQIKEKQIKIGDVVYVAPKTQYTQYVILSNLMKTKGSDASWENDMEPPPRFLDYSDDEQEQLARKQLRNKDRPNDSEDASKRSRTVDNEDSMSTSSSYHSNSQYRNSYEQRNNRGSPALHSNLRPRYNGPHPNQQRAPNHYRNSWHSNYNPQNFARQHPNNFRMHLQQNQHQSSEAYHSNVPVYGMPNAFGIPYPSSQPLPSVFHQHSLQPMANAPIFHGVLPRTPQHKQYTPSPPPPPGSQ